jgi:hypothetical protein
MCVRESVYEKSNNSSNCSRVNHEMKKLWRAAEEYVTQTFSYLLDSGGHRGRQRKVQLLQHVHTGPTPVALVAPIAG